MKIWDTVYIWMFHTKFWIFLVRFSDSIQILDRISDTIWHRMPTVLLFSLLHSLQLYGWFTFCQKVFNVIRDRLELKILRLIWGRTIFDQPLNALVNRKNRIKVKNVCRTFCNVVVVDLSCVPHAFEVQWVFNQWSITATWSRLKEDLNLKL